MHNIKCAIKDIVSITLFNRGYAGKIFEAVKKSGAKVVIKNNTAECVLLAPDEYIQLVDEAKDAKLLELALSRMQNINLENTIPAEDIYKKYNIDLEKLNEVECDDLEY